MTLVRQVECYRTDQTPRAGNIVAVPDRLNTVEDMQVRGMNRRLEGRTGHAKRSLQAYKVAKRPPRS